MNPSQTVGTRRDPLGFSAWRNIAHRIVLRVGSPFIPHWFKNRLPPSPTWQAGFSVSMLGKSREKRKSTSQNSWKNACYEGRKHVTKGAAPTQARVDDTITAATGRREGKRFKFVARPGSFDLRTNTSGHSQLVAVSSSRLADRFPISRRGRWPACWRGDEPRGGAFPFGFSEGGTRRQY